MARGRRRGRFGLAAELDLRRQESRAMAVLSKHRQDGAPRTLQVIAGQLFLSCLSIALLLQARPQLALRLCRQNAAAVSPALGVDCLGSRG